MFNRVTSPTRRDICVTLQDADQHVRIASAAFRNGTVIDIIKVETSNALKIFMATSEDPSFSLETDTLSTFNPVLPLLAELKALSINALGKPVHSAAISGSIRTHAFVAAARDAVAQLSLATLGWSRLNSNVILYDHMDYRDDWDPYDVEAIEDPHYALYLENTSEALIISLYRVDTDFDMDYQSYHRRFGQQRMRWQEERSPGSMPIIEAELTTIIGRVLQAEVDPRIGLNLLVFAGEGANDIRLRQIAHDAVRAYLPKSTPKMVPNALEDVTFHASRASAMLHKTERPFDELLCC